MRFHLENILSLLISLVVTFEKNNATYPIALRIRTAHLIAFCSQSVGERSSYSLAKFSHTMS
jgi:hypothetical protein